MREANISVGIDIGNTKIITCVGKTEDGTTDIIGLGLSENQGIRKGVIVDIEETVSAISASILEAERMSGCQITHACVGISGPFIECEQSKGIIAITEPNGVIVDEDVRRVIEAAKAIPTKSNREVLHVLPQNFIIDGSEVIKDPLGMTGIRLEVLSNIITASSNAVKSLVRAVEQTGIGMNELVFSPLSQAKFLLNKRQMDIGVILIDIGAATTSYVAFEEGEITICGVVPVGSQHITNDIAIGLRTNLDLAETIKLKYGYAMPDRVDEKEILELSKLDKNEDSQVKLRYVAEIIEARLNEIFSIIKENLAKNDCNDALPAGVILTGGGAKIDGIIDLTKETMRLPAKIGKSSIEISGLIDKLDDPIYSTGIGLMLWDRERIPGHGNFRFDLSGVTGVVDKVKSLFKHILP
ncbi:MAG: cell division protein FtsA [Candidatus Berkelbacteria bacterium]|nr:cell division protein FtsA [Candidatus Berkelbacteria bacterium]